MGRAEELFRRIKSGGANEIDRMVAEPVVEELFLDYKLAATVAPFTKLDPSVSGAAFETVLAGYSKNFSKAIAGFANSEGGIVIWGVDCRQNPPYGDIPTDKYPISDPVAFKTLLDNAISGRDSARPSRRREHPTTDSRANQRLRCDPYSHRYARALSDNW